MLNVKVVVSAFNQEKALGALFRDVKLQSSRRFVSSSNTSPTQREGLMLNTIMPHYFHTSPGNRNCLLVADNLTILVVEVRRKQNKDKKVKSSRSRIIVTPSDTEGSRMRCDCALSPVSRHVSDVWQCCTIPREDIQTNRRHLKLKCLFAKIFTDGWVLHTSDIKCQVIETPVN